MVAFQRDRPDWWSWELDCSNPHLAKRMIDRSFSEIDLRAMIEHAAGLCPNHEPGRWVVETTHDRRAWEIVVEPLPAEKILLVVTAYPTE